MTSAGRTKVTRVILILLALYAIGTAQGYFACSTHQWVSLVASASTFLVLFIIWLVMSARAVKANDER